MFHCERSTKFESFGVLHWRLSILREHLLRRFGRAKFPVVLVWSVPNRTQDGENCILFTMRKSSEGILLHIKRSRGHNYFLHRSHRTFQECSRSISQATSTKDISSLIGFQPFVVKDFYTIDELRVRTEKRSFWIRGIASCIFQARQN